MILFECLVGYAPFYANDPVSTCRKAREPFTSWLRVPMSSNMRARAHLCVLVDVAATTQIMRWRHHLVFPPNDRARLSPAAIDFVQRCVWPDPGVVVRPSMSCDRPFVCVHLRLVCDKEHRLGRGGVEEIKAHPFFDGVDWVGA